MGGKYKTTTSGKTPWYIYQKVHSQWDASEQKSDYWMICEYTAPKGDAGSDDDGKRWDWNMYSCRSCGTKVGAFAIKCNSPVINNR